MGFFRRNYPINVLMRFFSRNYPMNFQIFVFFFSRNHSLHYQRSIINVLICFTFQSSVFKRIKIYDYQAICLETEGEGSSSSVMLSVSSELNDNDSTKKLKIQCKPLNVITLGLVQTDINWMIITANSIHVTIGRVLFSNPIAFRRRSNSSNLF